MRGQVLGLGLIAGLLAGKATAWEFQSFSCVAKNELFVLSLYFDEEHWMLAGRDSTQVIKQDTGFALVGDDYVAHVTDGISSFHDGQGLVEAECENVSNELEKLISVVQGVDFQSQMALEERVTDLQDEVRTLRLRLAAAQVAKTEAQSQLSELGSQLDTALVRAVTFERKTRQLEEHLLDLQNVQD